MSSTDGYSELPGRDFSDVSAKLAPAPWSSSNDAPSSPSVSASAASDQPARNDHKRTVSASFAAAPSYGSRYDERDLADEISFGQGPALGLGISEVDNEIKTARRISIPRVPVGTRSPTSPPLEKSSRAPPFNRRASGVSFDPEVRYSPSHSSTAYRPPPFVDASRSTSAASTPGQSSHFDHNSTPKAYQSPFPGGSGCPSHKNIFERKADWLSVTILMLSIFSTFFSGFYLILAIAAPRYGSRISSSSGWKPSTASTISTLLAKLIELSFVTVFVAFLGQVLSRRAFIRRGKGINLAELSMRSWIMQPGTLITHVESVRYAGLTFLGAISLTAAIIAMFYTTASDALVSPVLKYDNAKHVTMHGQVASSYANPDYLAQQCATPIDRTKDIDPNNPSADNAGLTCLQVEYAGQAYHNLASYYANWTAIAEAGDGSTDLRHRPQAPGILYDNTTVYGSWTNIEDYNKSSTQFGRRVHNVTLAMPHAGIFSASRDPINNLLQPQDLAGLGEYIVVAAVPAPAVNIICAGLTLEELTAFNNSALSGKSNKSIESVDKVFGFGEDNGNKIRPLFGKAPIPFNTVLNTTFTLRPNGTVYLLGQGPNSTTSGFAPLDLPFELCSMSSLLTPNCSTTYYASMPGGYLSAACDESAVESQTYLSTNHTAVDGFLALDWVDVAAEAMSALSLGSGITDGNASNARLWTELIPTSNTSLDGSLPSTAEALAVMAGGSLLLSSLSTPLNTFDWNYSRPMLETPQYQSFSALVKSQQYSSGGNQGWQKIFFIVLVLVFATNLFVLVYLCIRRGQVTDFTEPQNLFALSINSPASQKLAGACGGGPEGSQWKVPWFVDVGATDDHVYLRNSHKDYHDDEDDDDDDLKDAPQHSRNESQEDVAGHVGMVGLSPNVHHQHQQQQQYSPVANNNNNIGSRRSRTPSSSMSRMSTLVSMRPATASPTPPSSSTRRLIEIRDQRGGGDAESGGVGVAGAGSPLMQSFEELSNKRSSIL